MLASQLQPGDLVFYYRLTLREAGGNLPAWLGDIGTAIAQWLWTGDPQGAYSGFDNLVHVGIIVRGELGALCVLEWVPGGMRKLLLGDWLRGNCHRKVMLPLSERYQHLFDDAAVCRWIEAHRSYRYRWLGLPFAVLRLWLGAPAPGAFFCSEAVVTLLRDLGIVPRELAVLRRGRKAWGEVLPHAYSPADVAALPQTARCAICELEAK